MRYRRSGQLAILLSVLFLTGSCSDCANKMQKNGKKQTVVSGVPVTKNVNDQTPVAIPVPTDGTVTAPLSRSCYDPPVATSQWEDTTYWLSPTTTGNSIRSIYRDSDRVAWTVGKSGTILYSDGKIWWRVTSGTRNTLYGIARYGGRLFAVGYHGTILVYGPLSANDDRKQRRHCGWRQMPSPTSATLRAIAVVDGVPVAVGDHGAIIGFVSNRWRLLESPTSEALLGVWGGRQGGVIVGKKGTIITAARGVLRLAKPLTQRNLRDVWGSGAGNIYAVGDFGTVLHFDGKKWTQIQIGARTDVSLRAIDGSGGSDIYIVGASAQMYHFDGDRWNAIDLDTRMAYFYAIDVLSSTQALLGGVGILWDFDGKTWTVSNSKTASNLYRIAASDVYTYAIGEHGTVIKTGVTEKQSTVDVSTISDQRLKDLCVFGDDDIYIVGLNGTALHYDGKRATELPIGTDANLYAIDCYYVDKDGRRHDKSGQDRRKEIVIAGQDGLIWRGDGASFRSESSGVSKLIYAVDHGIAVGANGTVLLDTPAGWRVLSSGTKNDLHRVAVGPTSGLAIGNGGVAVRINLHTRQTSLVDLGVDSDLSDVILDDASDSRSRFMISGKAGFLMRVYPDRIQRLAFPNVDRQIDSIVRVGEQYFMSGAFATVIRYKAKPFDPAP